MEKQKINKNKIILIAAIAAIVLLAVVVTVLIVSCSNSNNDQSDNSQNDSANLNVEKFTPLVIADGLQITAMNDYSGMFFEDGSDDIVSSIMMIVLENTSEKDLQLLRIYVEYEGFTAEYEATNVPAGRSVVLLEKNRHTFSGQEHKNIEVENMVFFSEKMDVMKDTFEVIKGDGFVELKNLSGESVDGITYVYYKNTADDILYGGVTYRATIDSSIPAGESARVLTQHFSENQTEIVQIVNVK